MEGQPVNVTFSSCVWFVLVSGLLSLCLLFFISGFITSLSVHCFFFFVFRPLSLVLPHSRCRLLCSPCLCVVPLLFSQFFRSSVLLPPSSSFLPWLLIEPENVVIRVSHVPTICSYRSPAETVLSDEEGGAFELEMATFVLDLEV